MKTPFAKHLSSLILGHSSGGLRGLWLFPPRLAWDQAEKAKYSAHKVFGKELFLNYF
jgi:hypothetical protein